MGEKATEIAIVSYNSFIIKEINGFVVNESNGWKDGENGHRVFLIQGVNYNQWANPEIMKTDDSKKDESMQQLRMRNMIEKMDRVVFYADGREELIVRPRILIPEKTIFVFCKCNYKKKMETINCSGYSSSRVILCECGGIPTMAQIYKSAMRGILP
jgi:hypothetical protein